MKKQFAFIVVAWSKCLQILTTGKPLLAAFVIAFIPIVVKTQDVPSRDFIKQHAIPVQYLAGANENVYKALSQYRLILVGECHGTAEPAAFVEGIVKSFLAHHREVILGIEIPADQMESFISAKDIYGLQNTKFFKSVNTDGKCSEAWANLLLNLVDAKIPYAYFDLTAEQGKDYTKRDSLMYENINNVLRNHPKAVYVGLCGNVHNRLKAFKDIEPMATFFQSASNSIIKDPTKIASINHLCQSGTAFCRTSIDSLPKVMAWTSANTSFADAVNYDNYLLIAPGAEYSGIIFTKKATASMGWKEDEVK